MKKTNLIKVILILVISIMVMSFATTVNAANDTGYDDLTTTLTANTSNTNNANAANTNTSNTSNTNTSNTNKSNTSNTNSMNKTNNSSIYNNTNTNLPKTGIEDSIPVAMLVVVFGISAVYAYRKIKEYRNI